MTRLGEIPVQISDYPLRSTLAFTLCFLTIIVHHNLLAVEFMVGLVSLLIMSPTKDGVHQASVLICKLLFNLDDNFLQQVGCTIYILLLHAAYITQ
jgi:hypothetical protein